MKRAADTTLPSIAHLAAPKVRGITAHVQEPHPLVESRCAACDAVGFVERRGTRLVTRLQSEPVDGVTLLTHAKGMGSFPEPWLTYIMSVELFEALRRAGLARGLSTFEFQRIGGRCKPYVGLYAETRLAPMATPYGRAPEKRNCDTCGYVNAAHSKYPLYPRPEGDLHWFGAPPWGSSFILASREVWKFLLGPGRALYGSPGAKVQPLRAGWWPDERDAAFEPPASP